MNNSLIVGYIDRLRIEDIDNFSRKMGVILEEGELELIYNYIKYEYQRFMDDPNSVLLEIRGKVREEVYLVINNLYNKYRMFLG